MSRPRARTDARWLPAWLVPAGLGLALAALTVWAWPARDELEPRVHEGNQEYRARRFPAALQQYEAAPGGGVGHAGVHLNRGLARFRIAVPPGDGAVLPELGPDASLPEGYERAQDEVRNAARGMPGMPMEDIDAMLRARAAYDLGNLHFARHAWQNAIDHYKEALRLRPGWVNAAWNLEVARRRKDEDEHPDADPDAGPDTGQQDASRDASPDSPADGDRDSGSDGSQGDGGGPGDASNGQGDGGSGPPDGGASSPDAGPPPENHADAGPPPPPPTSLAPLDQLERNEQNLQQMLLRRRAATMPRHPDDER